MDEQRYEMMWDCGFCGKTKLLGVTHRFCPGCGAAQNPEGRYFPADEDKVAVEDHEYTGADITCSACSTPLSAKVKFCTQCGSPTDGSKSVKLKQDPAEAARQKQRDDSSGQGSSLLGKILIAAGLSAIVFIGICIFWKGDVTLTVTNHTWKRSIPIEVKNRVNESAWCNSVPAGGQVYSQKKEIKSHKQVQDGQTCTKVKKDKGDGSYAESQVCEPKYKKVPVYGNKCYYKIERWVPKRTLNASGNLNTKLYWPKVQNLKKGNCIGCERQGKRKEVYTVHFSGDGKKYTCDYSSAGPWKAKAKSGKYKGKVGVISNSLDCSSLTR